jgi:glycosyltransferase involved in cell wall biosynthesis
MTDVETRAAPTEGDGHGRSLRVPTIGLQPSETGAAAVETPSGRPPGLELEQPGVALEERSPEARLVIVHDFLLQRGGAERVVDALLGALPKAELATCIMSDAYAEKYRGRRITTSYLQRAPVSERSFRMLLPLFAHAFSTLRLPEADIALCSSSGWAHLIAGRAEMPVVVYCHTPARWLWRPDQYFRSRRSQALRLFLSPLLRALRTIDCENAVAATRYVANSFTVADRIARCYGLEADVVYPPVDVARFQADRPREDFYLVVSRLLDYKRVDLAVDACSRTKRRLLVVGTGPVLNRLRRRAGSSVEFLGWQPDESVTQLMETCRALLFPGEEDFGITAVEAMAAGAPVVGFDRGGAAETIVHGSTGILFADQTVSEVAHALDQLEDQAWSPELISRHAEKFNPSRFAEEMRSVVRETLR